MHKHLSTAQQFIELTYQTLEALDNPTSEATATGLLRLASVQAQLATAKAIIELEETIRTWIAEAMWTRDERHSRTQPATPQPAETLCPAHGKAKASKSGGMYCPTKMPDGTYCPWTSKGAAKQS